MTTSTRSDRAKSGQEMRRRSLLKLGILAGAALLPMPALARLAPSSEERSITLYNLHTGERVKSTFWLKGHYVPEELHAIDHILRDQHSNAVTTIDRRLVELLHKIQSKLGTDRGLDVVCGYRSPKTNAKLVREGRVHAKNSFHITGRALDFRVPGYDLRHVRKLAMSLRTGGVGYYPRAHFIHVDTGPIRHW